MSDELKETPPQGFEVNDMAVEKTQPLEVRQLLQEELQHVREETDKLASMRPQPNKYLYMGSSLGVTFGMLGGSIVNSVFAESSNPGLIGQGMMVGMSIGSMVGGAMDAIANRGYDKLKNFVQEQHKKFTQRVWNAIPQGIRDDISKKMKESLKGNVYT